MVMAAILVLWPRYLNKRSFPYPRWGVGVVGVGKGAPHEIWLQSAQCSEEKMFENVDRLQTRDDDNGAYSYYKLASEPNTQVS